MNLDEIYNIIKREKGKLIIVEEGKPTLIIMDLEDYKSVLGEAEQKETSISSEIPSSETPSSEIHSSEIHSSGDESESVGAEPVEEESEYNDEKKFEELPI